MKKYSAFCLTAALISAIGAADTISLAGNWKLVESEISYKVDHPMKTAVGSSKQARGKGRCTATQCEFLTAASVMSFNSGDSNRDLHMLETTKGAANPMISVRAKFKPGALQATRLIVDFELQFAGIKNTIRGVELTVTRKDGSKLEIDGSFNIKLSDFAIVRPSLLGMEVENEVVIKVHAFWAADK